MGIFICKKVVLAGIYIVCCSETRFDVDMQGLISGVYMASLFCYSLETHIESLISGFLYGAEVLLVLKNCNFELPTAK